VASIGHKVAIPEPAYNDSEGTECKGADSRKAFGTPSGDAVKTQIAGYSIRRTKEGT